MIGFIVVAILTGISSAVGKSLFFNKLNRYWRRCYWYD